MEGGRDVQTFFLCLGDPMTLSCVFVIVVALTYHRLID